MAEEESIWKEIGDKVVQFAPTLGGILAPFTGGVSAVAGTAIAAIGKSFGLGDNPTPDAIKQAIATDPQAALKLQQAELDFQLRQKEQEIAELKIRLDDVKNARDREIATKDNVNKILAYSIVGAFIALVGGTLLGYAKVDSALAGTLVGYLSAKCEQILAYYFGSSKGSATKTELLAKAEAIKV